MSAVAVQIVRRVSTVLTGHLLLAVKNSKDDLFVIAALAGLTSFAFDFLSQVSPWFLSAAFAFAVCGTLVVILMPGWEEIEPAKVAHAVVFLSMTSILCAAALAAKESGYDPASRILGSIQSLKTDTDNRFDRTDEKLKQILDASSPTKRQQVFIINLTTNVPIPILVALQTIIDQRIPMQDVTQQNTLLLKKASEYALLQRGLAHFSPSDPRAQMLVQQAKEALARGDFDAAMQAARQAGELERASWLSLETLAHNRALTAARALESSAAIGRVSMRYDEAANDLSNAAKLAAAYDPRYARQLTTAKADTLLQQGNEVGDQAAISQAADIYRSVLSTASDTGADVASAQSGLNQALTKLGSRTDATALDRRSGAAAPVQNNLGSQRSATDRRENLRQVSAARYGSTAASRMSERAVATPGRAQERSNLASGSARSLQRRHLHELSAGRSPIEQSRSTIGGSPGGASEAASQVRSSGSDDQPGFFSRLKNWAGGSRGSSASSSPPAAEEPRSPLGTSQLFRPSSLDEQRSLVSRSRGQTSSQPSVGSTHHRKHSTN